MTGHTSFEELLAEPYKRWYQFGWRSPIVLWRRNRASHWRFRLRMAYQRAMRGYDDSQMWNLHYTLATLTVVGCRSLRELGHGYPAEFSDDFGDGGGWAAWETILLKIEAGFQAWLDEDGYFYDKPEQEAKFNEAMALYAKWFGALWD